MSGQGGLLFPFQDAFENFVINPVTSWQRAFNPQFFFTYNAQDVGLENHVLSRAGSYGKQLGRIIDMVGVLTARLDEDTLTPQEKDILHGFRETAEKVKLAKEQYTGASDEGIKKDDVNRFVDRLHALARTDPAAYSALAQSLRAALDAEGGPDR